MAFGEGRMGPGLGWLWPGMLLAAATLCGCGASVGMASQARVIDRTVARYGPELGYHVFPLGSQGLVLGATAVYFPPRGGECCHEFRLRSQFGYAVLPLPHEGRLGFEFLLGPSLGNWGGAQGGRGALGGMTEIALPWRVTHTRDLWEQKTLETIGILLPKIGMEMLAPLGSGSHQPQTALEVSLNFRLVQWHTALP